MRLVNILLIVSIAILGVYGQSANVKLAPQCVNTVPNPTRFNPYCAYLVSVMNCNSGSVNYHLYMVNAAGGVLWNSNITDSYGGWYNGYSSFCIDGLEGVLSFPIYVTLTPPNGVQSKWTWNGCMDTSDTCSPAGYNCLNSGDRTDAPTCP